MTIHSLDRPDTMPELADWLERQLVGHTLGELLAELRAVSDPDLVEPPLDEIIDINSVLKNGLKTASEDQIRRFFRHPNRLLELQERILIDGGSYWDQISRTPELAEASERVFKRLRDSISTPTARNGTRGGFKQKEDEKPRRQSHFGKLLVAAVLLIGLGVIWVIPKGPTGGGIAWNKPETYQPVVSPAEFLTRLARLGKEWFSETPNTSEQLAARIKEFRRGCDQLLAHENVIPSKHQKWLVDDCKKWSKELDVLLAKVNQLPTNDSSERFKRLRSEADSVIQTMIDKLELKAQTA